MHNNNNNNFKLLFKYNHNIDNLIIKLLEHPLKNNNKISRNEWKIYLIKLLKYNDSKIYKILRNLFIQVDSFSIERAQYLAQKIINIFNNGVQNYKINSLLDYGCGNGTITHELGKQLNCKNIYGADVKDIVAKDFKFILLEKNNLMPIINNHSIDLINASMVLHHVKNINETLSEFRRIISNNGYLIIREHDCKTKSFKYFLDILHGLYSLVWSDPIEDPNFIEEYRSYYHTLIEWDKIIESYGFKNIYTNYRKSNINAYYAIYKPVIIIKGQRNINNE